MHKQVYFNNSSTTKMLPEVIRAIKKELDNFDNPSDISLQGFQNHEKIEASRRIIAESLQCMPEEIYFTSSGSEGDNLCIKQLALKQRELTGRNHIITSSIEHKAVLNSCKALEKLGFDITYVKPNNKGLIDPRSVACAITDRTCLVSIMYVNNILGTIQPVESIGKICHTYNIPFHSDMVQALGNVEINLNNMSIDAATFSGHKIHGPKCGFVYIKSCIPFDSLIDGGGQESNKRAGTENMPYIVGLSIAVNNAIKNVKEKQKAIYELQSYIIEELLSYYKKEIRINGSLMNRISNNIHISFKNISGEFLVYQLSNSYNVCVSEGSACNTGEMLPDYVLTEIGLDDEYINGSIRITLNENNTKKDCDYLLNSLRKLFEGEQL